MKLIRTLVAATVALLAAVAVQMATSSGASAADLHTTDCGACWQIVGH